MIRLLGTLAAAGLLAAASPAAAQSVLVDEVETYGGIDRSAARAHLTRALIAAGYSVIEGDAAAPPCGSNLTCVRRRGVAAGADLVARAAYLDLADRISVSIQLVGADGGEREAAATVSSLTALDPDLVGALGPRAPEPVDAGVGGRRAAAWWLGGTGAALLVAGAGTLWYARSQREAFFDEFVDADGNVIGISPDRAREREERANRWLAAGYVLAGAGLAAGATSIILFSTGSERPALGVQGTF